MLEVLPYVLLAIGVTCLGFVGTIRGLRALWWILPTSALVLFSGLRDQVGTDFELYASVFAAVDPSSLGRSIAVIPQEPGFVALMFLVKQLTQEFNAFLTVCALLTVLPVMAVIRRVSEMPVLSLFLYIALAYYPMSLNAVRQSIAVSLVLLGSTITRGPLRWCLFIAAALIHASAVVAVLVMLLAKVVRPRIGALVVLAVAAAAVATMGIQSAVVRDFVGGLNERYVGYLDDSLGGGVGTVLVLAVHVLIALFCVMRLTDENRHSVSSQYVMFYLVSVPLMILATANWLFARFEPYFGIFAVLAVPSALQSRPNAKRWLPFGVVALAIYMAMHVFFYNGLIPYGSTLWR